jgi:long-chain acyl-CoA synthetase
MFLKYGSDFKEWKRLRYLALPTRILPYEVWEKMSERLPDTVLYNTSCPTETGYLLHYNATEFGIAPDCLGTTRVQGAALVINENFEPMRTSSANNPGIIAYKKEHCMMGYWRDEPLTQNAFHGDFLVTADVGFIDDRGFIHIIGRRDDVINSGGYKIAPYEVEETAIKMVGIDECICLSVKNNLLGEVPYLIVVMKEHAEFSQKGIYRWLADRLESYKLPRKIVQTDTLPLLPGTGKIDKRVLYQLIEENDK